MFSDMVWPSGRRAEQRRALASYIRRQVFPFSDFYRSRLGSPRAIKKVADLAKIEPTAYGTIVDSTAVVLRPTDRGLVRFATFELSLRAFFARLLGQGANVDRAIVEPNYKPITWMVDASLPVGASHRDLERLAEIGRRWLEAAGIRPGDRLVSVLGAGTSLAFWQTSLGARRAGVSLATLGAEASATATADLRPTVLVGRPLDVLDLLQQAHDENVALADVRLVLAVGDPLTEVARDALSRASGVPVLSAWAPPGVRAMWAECTAADGLHTWPQAEVLEVVDGEVLWTALDWAGTVFLRLRTGVRAAGIDEDVCSSCGRSNPRLYLDSTQPWYGLVLDTDPRVEAWQVEVGDNGLVVYLTPAHPGHPGPLVRDLDRQLRAAQYVVLERDELEARLARTPEPEMTIR